LFSENFPPEVSLVSFFPNISGGCYFPEDAAAVPLSSCQTFPDIILSCQTFPDIILSCQIFPYIIFFARIRAMDMALQEAIASKVNPAAEQQLEIQALTAESRRQV